MTNRKHHVKDKQITTLSGWFHSPLRVGERAIISGVNGFSILTSPMKSTPRSLSLEQKPAVLSQKRQII